MAELPEDEVEAVAQAAAGAARAGGGVVQVRAALLPELHLLAARVRAEAVADERQRAVEEIRAAKGEQVRAFGSDPIPYLAGRVDGLEDAARIVAAGSVAVATPEPEPTTMGPCGHYWATGPHTYTNTAQWPNVIGHCPGPVATPTEPAACICDGASYHSAEQNSQRRPFIVNPACPVHGAKDAAEWTASALAGSGLPAAHWAEIVAASPVPAEQPPTCAHRQLCSYPNCRHVDSRVWPAAEQPEER